MKPSILLMTALLAFAPALHAQTRTASQTEEIAAVRGVYQEVTRAAASRQLVRRDSTVQCSPDDLGQEVTRWMDASGRIRQLTWVAGSDDHAETHRFYYDGSGRLRFVFASRGAVNGTQQEERVYYAADGRLLRRRRSLVEGPGYPFGEAQPVWRPDEWLRRLCADGSWPARSIQPAARRWTLKRRLVNARRSAEARPVRSAAQGGMLFPGFR